MSDVTITGRVEPSVEPPREFPVATTLAAPVPEPKPVAIETLPRASAEAMPRALLEQLSRIEDKTSRIEEKYARTEALLLRVEDKVELATSRTGELAKQSELAALAGRVRSLPGFGALIVTAIIAAVLAAALTIAVLRYGIPGFVPTVLPR